MEWDKEIDTIIKETEVLIDEYGLGNKSPVFFTIDPNYDNFTMSFI
jgi:hypothetical protein